MFTATFCSRIVFEIAEKLRIANLSMADGVGLVLGQREVNFMNWQKACFALSVGLILAGIAAVFGRGTDILNIDFTGGSSVTLQTQKAIESEDMRILITDIFKVEDGEKPIESSIVLVEKEPANTAYTVVTSIDDEKLLSKKLSEGFESSDKADLVKLEVKVSKVKPSNNDTSFIEAKPAAGRLVSFQEEGSTTEQQPETSSTAPSEEAEITTEPTADNEQPAATPPAADESESELATAVPTGPVTFTEYSMQFSGSIEGEDVSELDTKSGIPGRSLLRMIEASAETASVPMNVALVDVQPDPMPTGWNLDDVKSYNNWKVRLPLAEADGDKVVSAFETAVASEPK